MLKIQWHMLVITDIQTYLSHSDRTNHGKLTILPSSYIGSPCHMQEYAQDTMAYVGHYRHPDLFITFTCDPTWEEIKQPLLPGQLPMD